MKKNIHDYRSDYYGYNVPSYNTDVLSDKVQQVKTKSTLPAIQFRMKALSRSF